MLHDALRRLDWTAASFPLLLQAGSSSSYEERPPERFAKAGMLAGLNERHAQVASSASARITLKPKKKDRPHVAHATCHKQSLRPWNGGAPLQAHSAQPPPATAHAQAPAIDIGGAPTPTAGQVARRGLCLLVSVQGIELARVLLGLVCTQGGMMVLQRGQTQACVDV